MLNLRPRDNTNHVIILTKAVMVMTKIRSVKITLRRSEPGRVLCADYVRCSRVFYNYGHEGEKVHVEEVQLAPGDCGDARGHGPGDGRGTQYVELGKAAIKFRLQVCSCPFQLLICILL